VNKILAGWWESSGTFKKCTAEKTSFVFLCLFDLILTLLAVNLGLSELNPVVRYLVEIPALLLIVKLFIPLVIAWLLPGKLLLPSIALLMFVVIWNLKELGGFISG
jgi:hypothetical protein